MSEFDWEQPGRHPPISLLLLHLDGELAGREAGAVQGHTAQCWECRAVCDRLRRGICGFMDYRNQVLLPAVPQPPSGGSRFLRHLRAETSKPVSRIAAALRLLRTRSGGRLPWAVAAALATITAFMIAPKTLGPPLGGPRVVSAAEFLQLVRASAGRLPASARTVICQEVEIRHGGRVYRREILRGSKAKPAADSAGLPRLLPVDWSDPLSADQFAAWRATLRKKRDSIEESRDEITLSTVSGVPAEVVSASLTVRRSDWHAVAKKLNMREGAAIEIREVAFEFRPTVERAPAASAAPTAAARVPSHPSGPPVAVSEAELQSAELDLREAFHRIGADVREAPRIWREKDSIRFSAWVETERRAREMRQAAAAAGCVAAEVHVPGDAAAPAAGGLNAEPAVSEPAAVTRPPLARQLWKTMGGMDAANRRLEEIGQAHADLLAAASSLARLAERYPESERTRFPAGAWQRVEKLAAEQIESVRTLSRRYLDSVSPVLTEMMLQQSVTPPAAAQAAGCGTWQELALAVAADTRSLQRSFRRLFVQEQVDEPVSFGAESLLRESAASRVMLIDHVRRLCAPAVP